MHQEEILVKESVDTRFKFPWLVAKWQSQSQLLLLYKSKTEITLVRLFS